MGEDATPDAPEAPHWNQQGGPFLAIAHPAVAGRERELRRLADAVRRVVHATVATAPSAEVTAEAAARLAAIADTLALLRPEEPFPPYGPTPPTGGPHTGSPYDVVHGMYNPLALPLRMHDEPLRMRDDEEVDGRRLAVGEAVFGTPYEGPPGLVHGAVIAGCFDMVLSGANRLVGLGGPTLRIAARYRRPTRLHVPCRFEGWFVAHEDRGRLHTEGRLLQEGETTVVVEGTFRDLPREVIDRLARGRS
jgi:hypothetical protein